MDSVAKTEYLESMHQYFESKGVYFLFEEMMESLILSQPENPLDHLLDHLQNPKGKFN